MILSLTAFENWTIALGFFTALGTIGATIMAVIATFIKMKNKIRKKSYEKKRNKAPLTFKYDLAFQNQGKYDILIESVTFKAGDKEGIVPDSEIDCERGDKNPLYVIKPMCSLRISSVLQSILHKIVPYNDFLAEDSAPPQRGFKEYSDIYKENYSNKKIKFTIVDSNGDTYTCRTKYDIKYYLQKYDKDNLVSPWEIESVNELARQVNLPCIYTASGRDDFDIFICQSDKIFEKILNKVKSFKYTAKTSKYVNPGFAFITPWHKAVYYCNPTTGWQLAYNFIKEHCISISKEDVANNYDLYAFYNNLIDKLQTEQQEIVE